MLIVSESRCSEVNIINDLIMSFILVNSYHIDTNSTNCVCVSNDTRLEEARNNWRQMSALDCILGM